MTAVVDPIVGIRALILQDADISALVTAADGARAFTGKMPQGEVRTSIVMNRISGIGEHHTEGPSGLARPRIQIDCWSQNSAVADQLSRLLKGKIDGFAGSVAWDDNSPGNAVIFQGILFESSRDNYDDTIKLFGVSSDYMVWFVER